MPKKNKQRQSRDLPRPVRSFFGFIKSFWGNHGLWRKIWVSFAAILILFTSVNYAVAQWYIAKHKGEQMSYGVTFVPDYARYYDLDPQRVLGAILNDLHVKQVRLVSYWDDIEPTPGNYDFSELDAEFAQAQKAGVKVSLAIGLRQPRWPECHMPNWANVESKPKWTAQLNAFITKVIERYRDNSTLDSYQLENEFFMKVFGICTNFDRDRLVNEFNMVKLLDTIHPVIISRSNNWVGIPTGQPRPDKFGISIYKRVWDKTITHRYFEYPLPAWFYATLAGWGELLTGKNMIIHELQAEPWVPDGFELKTAPLSEQNKSMNAERLKARFEYARATGMREIDLWGAEYWYWRKVHFGDPGLWNVAKEEIQKANTTN
jgi:hypothetical protein